MKDHNIKIWKCLDFTISIKWLDEKEAFKVGFHEPIKLGAVPAN